MARNSDTEDEKLDPSLIHKKKARRRLVGAVAFLGATAVAVPFLLDSEPKPTTQEVQIKVPVREPLSSGGPVITPPPLPPALPPVGQATPPLPPAASAESAKLEPKVEAKADTKPETKAEVKAEAKADSKKESKELKDQKDQKSQKDQKDAKAAKTEPKAETKADSKIDNKFDGKSDKKAENKKGYAVQIGAFASEATAKEQQSKLNGLGLKSYIEKVETSGGARFRVRAGPYSQKEGAEQALGKLKLNGIEAALVAM